MPIETQELARLGELAKKEDIETLKTVLAVPAVGGDVAVRLAPKSQQDSVINHAEAGKNSRGRFVGSHTKIAVERTAVATL